MYNLSPNVRTQAQEKNILYGIIALICLAPLPLGSNRPLPLAIITAFIGILSIYWGAFAIRNKAYVRVSLSRIKFPAIFMSAVMLWAIFQSMPLNIAFISNDFWRPAQEFDVSIKSSISVSRMQSFIDIYKLLAYAAIFWLAMQTGRGTKNARKIFVAIAFSGIAYAIYGLIVMALDSQKVLWFDKTMYLYSLTSTFINRNNYATYAGITMIVSLALFVDNLFDKSNHLKGREFYKNIVRNFFGSAMPLLIIILVILAALARSDSRAGIVSSAIGAALFIFLSIFAGSMKNHRKLFASISGIVICMLWLVFLAGGDETVDRFSHMGEDTLLRVKIYGITLKAIADFPLKGTGLGSFTDIFAAYRDDSLPGDFDSVTDHAHNSYLELMLELGIPAALLIILSFLIIVLRCLSGVRKRKQNNYIPAIAVSSAALVGVHALFDFSAQIPAVALLFIVLLAIGYAQSWSRREDISDASDGVKPVYHKLASWGAVTVGAILLFGGIWQSYIYLAADNAYEYKQKAFDKIHEAKDKGVLTEQGVSLLKSAQQDLRESLRQNPVNSYTWAYSAYADLLAGNDRKGATKLFTTSVANGFYEPNLLFFRIKLIPVLWASSSDDEKAIYINQIKQAWQWDSKTTAEVMSSPLAKEILLAQLQALPEATKEIEKFNKLQMQ